MFLTKLQLPHRVTLSFVHKNIQLCLGLIRTEIRIIISLMMKLLFYTIKIEVVLIFSKILE